MKKNILAFLTLVFLCNACFSSAYYNIPSKSDSAIQNDSNVKDKSTIQDDSGVKDDSNVQNNSTEQAGSIIKTFDEDEDADAPVYPEQICVLLKLVSSFPNDMNLHLKLAKAYENCGFGNEAEEEYNYLFINAKGNKEIFEELQKIFVAKVMKYSDSDILHTDLGIIYQQLEKYDDSFCEYKKAIELNPPGMPQRVALASLYIAQKDYAKAIPILDTVLSSHPHNIPARMQRANVLALMGLKERAVIEYKTVLDMQPTNFGAKIALYDILKTIEPRDNVIKILYKEYSSAPVGILAYYKLAGDIRLAKKYDEAIYFYKLAITIDPNFSAAYIDLADLYSETGNKDSAKSLLETAQKTLPKDTEIKKKYDLYASAQPTTAALSADDLIKKGSYDEAIKVYFAVIPPTVESLVGIASCYQFQSKYNEALDYLNKALSMDSSNSDIYYNFGFLYLNKEDFNSAKTYLNKSLELNPDNQKAKKLLIFVIEQETNKLANQILSEYDKKNYAQAMKLIDQMLKSNPENADAHYYRGLVFSATGKNFQAIPEFRNALKYDANYIMAYYSLAVSYDFVKKYKEAFDNYNKFLSLSKEDNEYTAYAKKRVIKLK